MWKTFKEIKKKKLKKPWALRDQNIYYEEN